MQESRGNRSQREGQHLRAHLHRQPVEIWNTASDTDSADATYMSLGSSTNCGISSWRRCHVLSSGGFPQDLNHAAVLLVAPS
jgi:hypothetical protein